MKPDAFPAVMASNLILGALALFFGGVLSLVCAAGIIINSGIYLWRTK